MSLDDDDMLMNGKVVLMFMLQLILLLFCRVNSSHNQRVTDNIVNDVFSNGEYSCKETISCKIIHIQVE